MKLIKYKGALPGPHLTTDLLSKEYDFAEGTCEMEDLDAGILLLRCGSHYVETEPSVIVADTGVGSDEITELKAKLAAAEDKIKSLEKPVAPADAATTAAAPADAVTPKPAVPVAPKPAVPVAPKPAKKANVEPIGT